MRMRKSTNSILKCLFKIPIHIAVPPSSTWRSWTHLGFKSLTTSTSRSQNFDLRFAVWNFINIIVAFKTSAHRFRIKRHVFHILLRFASFKDCIHQSNRNFHGLVTWNHQNFGRVRVKKSRSQETPRDCRFKHERVSSSFLCSVSIWTSSSSFVRVSKSYCFWCEWVTESKVWAGLWGSVNWWESERFFLLVLQRWNGEWEERKCSDCRVETQAA